MLREIVHFARHLPALARMSRRMSRVELLDAIEHRVDEAGKAERRASLVADLEDKVLEIGCGTGKMFPYYKSNVRLTATDPDAEFLRLAEDRARNSRAEVCLKVARGESLPFADASFDAVVSGTVLCAVPSVEQTLSEVKRVLRSGGRFRLIEHVRSDHIVPGLLMDALNPIWLAANGHTCNMNRTIEKSLCAAGFRLLEVKQFQLFPQGFPMAFPYRWIKAVAA